MAEIKYRASSTETPPVATTVKNAPLTNLEIDANFRSVQVDLALKSTIVSPTFSGTVVLPSTTSIGPVTNTEIAYLDGVTSLIQTQINTKAPAASPTFTGTVTVNSTTAVKLPAGTIAQRPAGVTGMIRYNADYNQFEGYNTSSWGQIGGGATGAVSDKVFWENDQVITADYTITTNKNAGTFGPVTINSGVIVTIPTGSVWTIA